MTDLFATEGAGAAGEVTDRAFQILDLAARRLDLLRRIRIAKIKMEYGLLTAEEMDDLILEGAELKADIKLWKAYR